MSWVRFVEEVQHLLAHDLHNGPAQLVALLNMQQGTSATKAGVQAVRRRLQCLRSPWLEGHACPGPTCLLELLPMGCAFELDWRPPPGPRSVTSRRLVQFFVEDLALTWELKTLSCRHDDRGCWLSWSGRSRQRRTGELWRRLGGSAQSWSWLQGRLELMGGQIEGLSEQALAWVYSDRDEPGPESVLELLGWERILLSQRLGRDLQSLQAIDPSPLRQTLLEGWRELHDLYLSDAPDSPIDLPSFLKSVTLIDAVEWRRLDALTRTVLLAVVREAQSDSRKHGQKLRVEIRQPEPSWLHLHFLDPIQWQESTRFRLSLVGGAVLPEPGRLRLPLR